MVPESDRRSHEDYLNTAPEHKTNIWDGAENSDPDISLYDSIHAHHSNPTVETFQQLAGAARRELKGGDKERWLTKHLGATGSGKITPALLQGVDIPDHAPDTVRHAIANHDAGAIFRRKLSTDEMQPDFSFDVGELNSQIDVDDQQRVKSKQAEMVQEGKDTHGAAPSINSDKGRNLRGYLQDDSHAEDFWQHAKEQHDIEHQHVNNRNDQIRELLAKQTASGSASIASWMARARGQDDAGNLPGFDTIVQAVRDNPSEYSAILDSELGESSGEDDIESQVLDAIREGIRKIPSIHDDDFLDRASQSFYRGSKLKNEELAREMADVPFSEGMPCRS